MAFIYSFKIPRSCIESMQSSSHIFQYVSSHASVFAEHFAAVLVHVFVVVFFSWERSVLLVSSATYDVHSSNVRH